MAWPEIFQMVLGMSINIFMHQAAICTKGMIMILYLTFSTFFGFQGDGIDAQLHNKIFCPSSTKHINWIPSMQNVLCKITEKTLLAYGNDLSLEIRISHKINAN